MKTKIAQHTPGPWQIDGNYVKHGDFNVVASVNHVLDGEGLYNARLIAAAPDLLAALEGIIGPLITMNRIYKPEQIFELLDKHVKVARAAIAKAEGR